MMKNVYVFLIFKLITNIAGVAAILFLSAGTFFYPEGQLFTGLLVAAAAVYAVWMLCKHPKLLKQRLLYRETNPVQQLVIGLCLIICVATLSLAGLTHRFGWYSLPQWRYGVSVAAFGFAAVLLRRVIRENAFLTSEITVQEEQTVISTGPYKRVRHPMYTAMLLFLLSAVVALGSIAACCMAVCFLPVLVLRIRNEEQVLTRELPGYSDYLQRVRYRLIPFIW